MLPSKNSKEFRNARENFFSHANKSGSNTDVVDQQYIEYPRALCTIDGLPV